MTSATVGVTYYLPSISSLPQAKTQQVTDMADLNVTVPTNVERVVGLNHEARRLITYPDAASMVCGVEQIETDLGGRHYAMAPPEYVTLPVIGPQFGGNPELTAAQKPDVAFVTDTVASDIGALQSQLGLPVVGIVSGGLDTQNSIQAFYNGLTLMGNVLHKEDRAASVIDYVSGLMADLQTRTSNITDSKRRGCSEAWSSNICVDGCIANLA